MQHNLKTLSKALIEGHGGEELFEVVQELRQTLAWLEKWKPRTIQNKTTKESWKHAILEILGEA
jgi:hypothetical protein